MKQRKQAQKGAVEKAEGTQGAKTRGKFIEQLQSGQRRKEAADVPEDTAKAGRQRLYEGRQQHDEADKHSEKTRLSREVDRQKIDRDDFQLPGASAS
jgi:hypothetical protein